ncbi:hypothetical protein CLV58_11482 [Spirosoma oryzae]|uniref:Uncharacterized protein n=1 Tax=Spirosoma oryzae TaxID=1469603 RepID=A0A2T0SQ03_9BACT|nr:hypothetical protein CLV58_11482 [Spirosoma oryzae]
MVFHSLVMNPAGILVSAICCWVVTITYLDEAVRTREGKLCKVKCTAAALLYASVGTIMLWLVSTT